MNLVNGNNPAEELPQVKPGRGVPRPVTKAEYAKLLAEAKPLYHDWFILGGMVGLRAMEAAKIKGSDLIEHEDGYSLRVQGKGGTDLIVPIAPSVAQMIMSYKTLDRLWQVTANKFSARAAKEMRRILGPEAKHFHSLRHYFATTMLEKSGGLSLKPTPNSMDLMKCDMAGAAAVGCTMYAIAKAKLNVHVIALVPATDNRPGFNAFAPGDIITMMDGSTVEMLNSDAEGRMILADALHYAKRYKPEMAIELSTLTGAAAAAIGQYGIVSMGTATDEQKTNLTVSGLRMHERLAEFPFWDEYDELIKSDIADQKNLGGPYGGAITAGKFLVKYTDYPYMHFDIAGPAFVTAKDSYRGKGGTGYGVRLLFDFFSSL
jgi:hypothetical protein